MTTLLRVVGGGRQLPQVARGAVAAWEYLFLVLLVCYCLPSEQLPKAHSLAWKPSCFEAQPKVIRTLS